jgi:glycosyltransferase involved in cell wall biosynthesis
MLLSVLIPVYNEEKTIEKLLERVYHVKLPKYFRKELVIINDGSTDKTLQILIEDFQLKPAVRACDLIIKHPIHISYITNIPSTYVLIK